MMSTNERSNHCWMVRSAGGQKVPRAKEGIRSKKAGGKKADSTRKVGKQTARSR